MMMMRVLAFALMLVLASGSCNTDSDCSLNGKCETQTGHCKCDSAWHGNRCEKLFLLPADRRAGLQLRSEGTNISTWGGAVQHSNDDGRWHMWASEMENHCGIESWSSNSFIVHASASEPTGAYEPVREGARVFPVFSHEPTVTRAPTGEFVMFFVMNPDPGAPENCTAPAPPMEAAARGDSGEPGHPGAYSGTSDRLAPQYHGDQPTYMSWARSANGPWSDPVEVIGIDDAHNADSNLAATIYPNGSLVGMWRSRSFPAAVPGGSSRVHLLTARDWRDPSTYDTHANEDLFPSVGYRGLEDMFVWLDARGNAHAIFHHMDNATCPNVGDLPACGGHAFSADGISWTYGGVAFGRSVNFADGTVFNSIRRERPHLIMAADGVTPVALTSGVQYGTIPYPTQKYGPEGAVYTLLQPVRTQ